MTLNSETPILITGLPRSGTSMTAGIMAELGVFTGPTVPGGEPNPKGFFENTVIREKIIKGILKAGDFCPLGVRSLPPRDFNIKISFGDGKSLKEILHNIIKAQGYSHNLPWLYKDAKLSLLWRIFNSQFPDALWVVVRRNRQNFIRSCLRTHFMVQHSTEEDFWNKFADDYELRLKELIQTVNRVIEVDTDAIISGNFNAIETLCEKIEIDFSKKIVDKFVSPEHWNRNNK
jgi:hypothetical protein